MEETITKIQSIIQKLINGTGCSCTVDFIEYPENVYFAVYTRDGSLLIGENGERLKAINHIVHKTVDRQFLNRELIPKFFVDINDYQKQKVEEIKDLARLSAQRVRYFKKEVSMEPMGAYERRVVHTALTEYPDIVTESVGEGAERKVVIKPLS